jgi:hypothetical protein
MFSLDEKEPAKKSNVLGVKVRNYGECGWCNDPERGVTLNVPWEVWTQWIHISRQMGAKEWGGVFWVKGDTVTQFKIPKQEVSGIECEFKEEIGGDGIVHSHHDMGAFHSSQDDRYARNLYAYSIVLSNSRGCEATKRVKLPCGGFGYVKVELCLVGCPEIGISNITEKDQKLTLKEMRGKEDVQKKFDFGSSVSPCDACELYDCERCEFLHEVQVPCEECDSFDCKECRFVMGRDFRETLPFCELCEEQGECRNCFKLAQYFRNYPEDKDALNYLLQ